MPQIKVKVDIVVVGAGAIGAACALQMARQKPHLSIAVVERQTKLVNTPGTNQRVWALGAAATDLLKDLGVFAGFTATTCHPYSKMVVWDENSDGELSFDASEYGAQTLGFMVDADRCTELLQNALHEQKNIELFCETNPIAIDFSLERPQLKTDTECFTAGLIVAADGANSWVRQQAKIFAPSISYGQYGLVTNIETQYPHQNTAWQRFLSSGPVAVLPLANNRSSIVWSCANKLAQELLSVPAKQFEDRLQSSLQNRLGKVSLKGDIFSFALQSRHAEAYTKPGLALIGDAAHSIHPLAGQGANLGFKDALELSNLVAQFDSLDDSKLLQSYQRNRRRDNLQTDFLMTSLHNAYKLNLPVWSLVRGIGMNWLSRNKLLKTQLARQAMGL